MLHFSLFSLAALALSPLSEAVPAAAKSVDSATIFSFAQWAKEISENPNGKHLSPEKAFEAFEAAHNQTGKRDGGLEKRGPACGTQSSNAYAPEAASCVSYLAAKGSAACTVPKGGSGVAFCSTSQSQIYGYAGGFQVSVACNDIAVAGGHILDSCTHPGGSVNGGDWAGNIYVAILGN
ncbi:hypothetical protein HDV63DRAFT_413712 [Trichoderma sp. SZMC 28014]